MPEVCQYRQLVVSAWDKHSDNPAKRRRGANIDRFMEVDDSAHEQPVKFADQDGDDRSAFAARARHAFAAYLNHLGTEGWVLVSRVAEAGIAFGPDGYTLIRLAEGGTYIFVRRT